MKDKILGLLNTTTKKIVAVIITIIVLVGVSVATYALTRDNTVKLVLKKEKEEIVVEYGSSVSLDPKEYLELSKLNDKEKEKVLKETKLETNLKNEDSKEYLGIGKFEITITFKKQKLTSKVDVKDSVAPVFNEINEVSFEEGTDFNYAETITSSDLQEVTVAFDTASVNKDVVGEYVVKAIAEDKSGNETIKDIKVIVTAKPVVETSIKKPSTANVAGTNNGTSKPSGESSNVAKPNPPATNTPAPEIPHVHTRINEVWEGYWFDTKSLADAAAEHYIDTQPQGQYIYDRYGVTYCPCGKQGVIFIKGQ